MLRYCVDVFYEYMQNQSINQSINQTIL